MAYRLNGVPVQNVGELFPFVVFRHERDGVAYWGILGPGIVEPFSSYLSHDAATDAAKVLKAQHSGN